MDSEDEQTALRGQSPAEITDYSMWSLVDLTAEATPHRIPDLDVESMRTLMTLRTASDMIFYDIHAELRRHADITAPALRVLLFLQIFDRLELAELTRMTGMSRASASALIASMNRQGLLIREGSETDHRKLVISMSPHGEDAFVAAYTVFNRRETFWAEGLDRDERAELIRLVNKMVRHRLGGSDYRSRA